MKKLLIFFLLLGASLSAQDKAPDEKVCTITALDEIIVGEEVDFITNLVAQCTNCYDWDIAFGDVDIITSSQDQQQTVTIRPNSAGNFSLRVTSFDEYGCHTCTKAFVAVQATEPCFEPIIAGKIYDTHPNKTGNVRLDFTQMDLSNVNNFTWIFDPNDNGSHYGGFLFSNNQTSIQSFNKLSGFSVDFSFSGTYPSSRYICFDYIVEFEDPTTCEVGYYADMVCGNLLDPEPTPIIISPNPSKNNQSVNFQGIKYEDLLKIEIIDIYGLKRSQFKPTKQSFDIDNLNSGIYILKFTTINNEVFEKKLVVE